MNVPTKIAAPSLLMDPEVFNHMQRVGGMLALSPLFPEHLRKGSKESAIANGVLVMNMAARLNEDPLTVAQNIYFVSGKPGWSSSYMIAKANQHGVFKNPIDWEVSGEGQSLSVTAFAVLASTGKRVSVTCDMNMAKAEGWTSNKKYQSMPQQMLRYRSATFLIRLYCPEVMVGVPSQVEIELGMKDITPDDYAETVAAKQDEKSEPEDAVLVEEAEDNSKTGDAEARATEDAKAKAAAAEKEEKQRAAAKAAEDQKANADAEQKAAEEKHKPDEEDRDYGPILNTIKTDLLDSGWENSGTVLDYYKVQIADMEREAPEAHADLEAYIEELRKSAADEGGAD